MSATETRQRLIEAAAELMWRAGYQRTSVDDIIGATGVCKGSFYHHFPSKESLGVAVIDAWVEHLGARIRDNVSESGGPAENISAVLDGIVAAQREAGGLGCPLGRLALEMADVSELLRQRLQRGFDGLRSLLAGYLEQGGMPPEEAARRGQYLVATLEGSLMLDRVLDEGTAIDDLIETMKSDVSDHLVAFTA